MTFAHQVEARRPPSNAGPGGGLASRLVFAARRFLDLQLDSVVRDVGPWLRGRSGSLLEIGCGDQPYRSFLPPGVRYVGLDWQSAGSSFNMKSVPDVIYYDGTTFPVADEAFDSVMHTEVLEHVVDVPLFLAECLRILKPGGEMILTVPFQARFHFIPHDYWRFTPSGLEHILQKAGFTRVNVVPRGTDAAVAAYKVVSLLYRMAYGGLAGKIVFLAFSWLVVLLLAVAHVCMRYGIGSSDDCIGYTVTASRPGKAAQSNVRHDGEGCAATG